MSVNTSYTVSGMTCEHCVRSVTQALTGLPGVEQVEIDLAGGRVDVRSEQPLDEAEVARVVEDAGYDLAGR